MMKRLAILALTLLPAPAIAQAKPPSSTFNDLKAWKFGVTGISPLDTSLSTRSGASNSSYKNPNAVRIGSGNMVSFCPALSCLAGDDDISPDNDHQRASLLVSSRMQDDAHSQEQSLAVITTIDKGRTHLWQAGKTFNAGDNLVNFGNVYRAAAGCVTAGTGSGPSAVSINPIADGSCSWKWINASGINAKVGAYFETKVVEGAGSAWGAAFNYHLDTNPNGINGFFPGVEIDYANTSGSDCQIPTDCTAVRLGIAGNAKITHGMQITGDGFVRNGIQGHSMLWGLRINGEHAASEASIEIDTQSKVGLGFGTSGIGDNQHSQATIKDQTTSPTSFDISGSHAIGVSFNGTFSGAQIAGKDFTVFPDGGTRVKNLLVKQDDTHQIDVGYNTVANRAEIQSTNIGAFATEIALNPVGGNVSIGGMLREVSSPPANASSACITGTRTWDVNYEYRCVATNTWKRSALSAW